MVDKRIPEDVIWKACEPLREEQYSIEEYIDEISPLLFIKVAEVSPRVTLKDTGDDTLHIPKGYRWTDIVEAANRGEGLEVYEESLDKMEGGFVQEALGEHRVRIDSEKTFSTLVNEIEKIPGMGDYDEFNEYGDAIGNAYEFLLSKYSGSNKVSGQYFTPRPLTKAMVEVTDPSPGDSIMDPAAGTNGFILECHDYIMSNNEPHEVEESNYHSKETRDKSYRLGLLNYMMHGINPGAVDARRTNTLAKKGRYQREHDLVITNPPFGSGVSKKYNNSVNSSIEFQFMKVIMDMVKEGGKVATVVPEGVLFNSAAYDIREELLNHFDIDTILALPKDLFEETGVDTNVIFFEKDSDGTDEFWFYDGRTDYESIKKSNPLKYGKNFGDFVNNWDTREESENYFKVDSEEIDEENLELHIKKYKEFKYEGHRAPSEIADDIRDELDKIKTELDRLEGDKND